MCNNCQWGIDTAVDDVLPMLVVREPREWQRLVDSPTVHSYSSVYTCTLWIYKNLVLKF